jgi:hypothetical protein
MRPAISSAAGKSLVGLNDDGQVGANLRQIGQGATGVDVKKLQRAA